MQFCALQNTNLTINKRQVNCSTVKNTHFIVALKYRKGTEYTLEVKAEMITLEEIQMLCVGSYPSV